MLSLVQWTDVYSWFSTQIHKINAKINSYDDLWMKIN